MNVGPEKMQQMVDEAEAGMRDIAKLTVSFYNGLIKEGMNVGAAIALTAAWVSGIAQRKVDK